MVDTQVADTTVQPGVSLTESINKAIEATPAPDGASKVEETPKAEEKKEEPKPKDYGLSDTDLESAKQLFAALKDPEQSQIVLEYIAKQAGYGKIETKVEAKEAKDDLKSLLSEALTDVGLDSLSDRLAPAIEKWVDKKLKDDQKDIREKLAADESAKLTDLTNQVTKSLAQKHFKKDDIPDDILTDMNKYMDRVKPGKDTPLSEYIEGAFFVAMGKRGLPTVVDEKKVEKNRNDVGSRLAAPSGGGAQPIPGNEPAKKMSLDAAIRAAVEKVSKE